MRKKYVGLSAFFSSVFALFARPSAYFLGALLLATTLSSCSFVEDIYKSLKGGSIKVEPVETVDDRKVSEAINDLIEKMADNKKFIEVLGTDTNAPLSVEFEDKTHKSTFGGAKKKSIIDSIQVSLKSQGLFTLQKKSDNAKYTFKASMDDYTEKREPIGYISGHRFVFEIVEVEEGAATGIIIWKDQDYIPLPY